MAFQVELATRGKVEEEERKKQAEEDEENNYDITSFLRDARKFKPKSLKHGSFRKMGTQYFKLSQAPTGRVLRRGTTFEYPSEEMSKTPVKKKTNTIRKQGTATESKTRKNSLLLGGAKED